MLKLLDNEIAFGRIGINCCIRNRFFRNRCNRLSMEISHMESRVVEETDAVGSTSEIYDCIHSAVRDHSVYHLCLLSEEFSYEVE